MNKKFIYGLIGAIVVVCIIAITGAISARKAPNPGLSVEGVNAGMRDNVIKVTGQGKVSIKPDVAYLNVGVRTLDKDAKKAQNDNKVIMSRIMAKLKAMKIDEKDIQTSSYNIWPKYNYNGNKEILEGYEVENMIRITVHKVDTVGDVLDAVAKEGANRSDGISFGVLDTDALYKQALEKAVEDAKSKAEVLGNKAGVAIQNPLAIYEGSVSSDNPIEEKYYTGGMSDLASEMDAGVPIVSGELEIKAYVTIVYQTK